MPQPGWKMPFKPARGTPLDTTGGLARGLAALFPCWEGTGSTITDVVAGVKLAVNGAATWSDGGSPMVGAGLELRCRQRGAAATIPAALQLQAPLTLVAGYRYLGSGATGDYVMSLPVNNTGVSPYIAFGMRTSSAGVFGIIAEQGSTGATAFPGYTMTAGQDVVVSAVFNATTYAIYAFPVGAAPIAPVTGSYGYTASAIYSSTAQVALGAFTGNTTNPHFQIYFAAILSRAITSYEAASLGTNFWQFFGPQLSLTTLVQFGQGADSRLWSQSASQSAPLRRSFPGPNMSRQSPRFRPAISPSHTARACGAAVRSG